MLKQETSTKYLIIGNKYHMTFITVNILVTHSKNSILFSTINVCKEKHRTYQGTNYAVKTALQKF